MNIRAHAYIKNVSRRLLDVRNSEKQNSTRHIFYCVFGTVDSIPFWPSNQKSVVSSVYCMHACMCKRISIYCLASGVMASYYKGEEFWKTKLSI